jgi:leucyl aminopeptidase
LPLSVGASLLPRLGSRLPPFGPNPLEAYISAITAGEAEPADLIAVGVQDGGSPRACAPLDALLPANASRLAEAYGHSGKPGEVAESAIFVADHVVRILLLGVGDRSAAALRRAGAELARRCADGKTAVTDIAGEPGEPGEPGEDIAAFAEGVLLGGYRFRIRSEPDEGGPGAVHLLPADPEAAAVAVSRATAVAQAVAVARDLANTPSAGKSPQWLADEAVRITAGRGVDVRIWTEEELAAGGFGGLLAVGSGSVRPPRLIELSYQPPHPTSHVVLVGKGITFDSGGLSLKPTDSMKLMKTDMAGGGTVIAVLSAVAELGVGARVTGLVAAAENMPSGSAYRPGDVISQFGGRSVEVLNTDAEGRLVLADALAYAVARLAPDQIVDIATLTGAARVALGGVYAALYATCDSLADALIAAGEATGDRLWRMPLEPGYRPSLDSPVADIAHVARSGQAAGSILAALFLREFVAATPWAHLDIAGPGRAGADDGELTKGATGFGARLLLGWLAPA